MTRKRTTPPWVRRRKWRRTVAVLAILSSLLIVAALVFSGQHRGVLTQVDGAATLARKMPPTVATSEAALAVSGSSDMPDSALTPGEAVTTDAAVICRPGYATNIRPEGALWRQLKEEAYARYGLPRGHRTFVNQSGVRQAAYQVDHLVPLELGGSPTDLRNLWPQPIVAAKQKDEIENELHDFVCSGQMSLRQAQTAIARDWKTALPAGVTR